MSNPRLYSGLILLDYNGTPNVRHNALDIRDTNIGSSSKSYNLEIPLTPHNRRTLSIPDVINNRQQITDIFRLYSGNTLLIKGKFRVFTITKETISGIIEAKEWIADIENLSIRDLGWVGGDDHTFSSANVTASWVDKTLAFFRYPLVNFGKLWSEQTGVNAELMPWDFVPMWNIYAIIKKIFAYVKYSLDDTPGENDLLPYSEAQRVHSTGEPDYYHFGFSARNPTNGKYVHITRIGNSHLGNEGKLIIFKSDDGITWGAATTLIDSAYDDRLSGGGYDKNGRLHWFYGEHDNTGGVWRYLFYNYSDDDGVTWGSPQTLATAVYSGPLTDMEWVLNNIIERDDGSIMMPTYGIASSVWFIGYLKCTNPSAATPTWVHGDIKTTAGTYLYQEPSLVNLGNGQVLCLCRIGPAAPGNSTFRQFYSSDNGVTWADHGNTTFETWTVAAGRERPPYIVLMDYLGRKIVACYYINPALFKFRVVYANAEDFYTLGVAAWKGYGSELLTVWYGGGFDTFTSSGKDITSAIEAAGVDTYCYTPIFNWLENSSKEIRINITLNSGTMPQLSIRTGGGAHLTPIQLFTLTPGANTIIFKVNVTRDYRIYFQTNGLATDFSAICSIKDMGSVTQLANATEYSGAGYTRDGYQTAVHVKDKWQGLGAWYNEVSTNTSDIVFFKSPIDNRITVLTSLGLNTCQDSNFFALEGRDLYIMGEEPVAESGFANGKSFIAYILSASDNSEAITHTASATMAVEIADWDVRFKNENEDQGGDYGSDIGKYIVPETGIYRFFTSFRVYSTHTDYGPGSYTITDQHYRVSFLKNNTDEICFIAGTDNFDDTYNFKLDTGYIRLLADDFVTVRIDLYDEATNVDATERECKIEVSLNGAHISRNYHDKRNLYKGFGATISPVTYLPDITCLELLKALKHLYGLRFWVDALKRNVHVYNTDKFITDNVLDWTNFIDHSELIEQQFIAADYKKRQIIKYKDDSGDKALQDYLITNDFPLSKIINLNNEYCEGGIETRENDVFAPTIESAWWTGIAGNLPVIYDDFTTPDTYPANRLTEWVPRLFKWDGLYFKTFRYNTNYLDTYAGQTRYPKASCPDISVLFGLYFQRFWHYIEYNRMLTITIIMDVNKLNQFITVLSDGKKEAFRSTYKLTIDGVPMYFVLNNLVTDGIRAKCEFIQKL